MIMTVPIKFHNMGVPPPGAGSASAVSHFKCASPAVAAWASAAAVLVPRQPAHGASYINFASESASARCDREAPAVSERETVRALAPNRSCAAARGL